MSDQQGVYRGPGVVPGQGPGEAMPDIKPDVKPASAGDFQRMMRERDNAAQAKASQPQQQPAQPPSARGRVASFSEKLEASQQAPVGPNDPKPEKPVDPGSQPKPAHAAGAEQPAPPAQGEPGQEDQPAEGTEGEGQETSPEPEALDDLAALAKYREWEQGDFFPDELLSKLHEVKVDGRLEYVDGNELRSGYTRGGAARRMVSEAKQQMQIAQQHQQSMQQHFEQVRDPQNMLAIYERQGYGETLYEVAKLIAERDRGDRLQVRGAQMAEMQRLGIQDPNDHRIVQIGKTIEQRIKRQRVVDNENARLQFERQQFEAARQAEQNEKQAQQDGAVLKRQVDQLRPLALKAYGIPANASNVKLFNVCLSRLIDAQGLDNGNITKKMVMDAGSDVQDELRRDAQERAGGSAMSPEQWKAQQQGQRPAQGRTLPPNRVGLGGGKPNGQLAGKQRGSITDLENRVRANRMRQ